MEEIKSDLTIEQLKERYASETGVVSDVHDSDLIYKFLIENPVFRSINLAVKYYFVDGQKSAKKLRDLLVSLGVRMKRRTSILEFASGYGCVTRHMIKELKPLKIVSCDIHEQACSFISSTIGNKTILSSTKPEDLPIKKGSFDVVFALSFFSHMPENTWKRWLSSLFDKVKPGGHLIFTTQGMSSKVHLGDPIIPESGFWFMPSSEQSDLDVADYGNTIVTTEYVKQAISEVLQHDVSLVREAGWWEHQDLYVIKKITLSRRILNALNRFVKR